MLRAMAHQYVFTMHRLTKVFPPDREVFKDVTLAFLPGAKIGVLGYNGSGKSTLLRLMAGRGPEFRGDASPAPATRGAAPPRGAPPGRGSACPSRIPTSTRPRTCAGTSRRACSTCAR